MTNNNFAEELKTKQHQGLLTPSDFKKNKRFSKSQEKESSDLTIIQTELSELKEKFQQSQQIITSLQEKLTNSNDEIHCLKNQKEALELALFDKR